MSGAGGSSRRLISVVVRCRQYSRTAALCQAVARRVTSPATARVEAGQRAAPRGLRLRLLRVPRRLTSTVGAPRGKALEPVSVSGAAPVVSGCIFHWPFHWILTGFEGWRRCGPGGMVSASTCVAERRCRIISLRLAASSGWWLSLIHI